MEIEATTESSSPAEAEAAKEALERMLEGLGLETKVEQCVVDESLLLHIATPEPGRLIGKHGQTLAMLQFLLNRVLQRHQPPVGPVIVDCERYRERQRDDLINQVFAAADRVRRWGEEVRIGPYTAFDRRIIHGLKKASSIRRPRGCQDNHTILTVDWKG